MNIIDRKLLFEPKIEEQNYLYKLLPFYPKFSNKGEPSFILHNVSLHQNRWPQHNSFKMAALSKVADVLQKSVAFTCMAASVYLLVFTGRNYLALREKRLANAAIIASQKEIEVSSESAVVPGQEDTSPKP